MGKDIKRKTGALTRIKNWLLGRDIDENFETTLPKEVDETLDIDETKRVADEKEKQLMEAAREAFRQNVKETKQRISKNQEAVNKLQDEKVVLDNEAAAIQQAVDEIKELDNTLSELDTQIEADQKFIDEKKIADAEELAKAEAEAKHEADLKIDPNMQDIGITGPLRSGKFADYEVTLIQDYLDNDLFEEINWDQLADGLNRSKQSVKNKAKAIVKKRKMEEDKRGK